MPCVKPANTPAARMPMITRSTQPSCESTSTRRFLRADPSSAGWPLGRAQGYQQRHRQRKATMLLANLRREVMPQRAAHLVERLVDALLVSRLLRLEAERERIRDASDADLLAAVDVEQPELVEQRSGAHPRDAQELADLGCFVDHHGQVAIDRLSRGNRS